MSGHYSAARLRRGVAHFLLGKVGSAGLTFAAFVLVARMLAPGAYGHYVTLVAVVELGLYLSSLGLDWVSARYVPEYRTQARASQLVRLVRALCGLQALALALAGLLLLVGAPWLTDQLGITEALPAARLYAVYLLAEGLGRVLRDQMLAQLLLQGRAQAALLLRHLVWVGLLLALWVQGGVVSVADVAAAELAAAATGLVAAAIGLWLALRRAGDEAGATPAAGWQPPARAEMRRLAFNSYLALLVNVPARPQVVMLLVTRFAGAEVAAVYGFARNLADQVLRFLPAELLLGFLRPALVARYVQHGQATELNRQTNALLLVSLLVLAPVLALALGRGDLLVEVLGGGRFAGSAPVLALMLLAVALFSHRRMLEFVANTVGTPEVVGRASLVLLAVPLLVVALLQAGAPVWWVPLGVLGLEGLFGLLAMHLLRRGGVTYRAPLAGTTRTLLAMAGAATILYLLPLPGPAWLALLVAALAAVVITAGLAWLLKALDPGTLGLLRSLARK